ncbi:hypothetical protein CBR_g40756 [Chara braunii]|uniref:Myb-like domain-containing protein n=1 Tax=Chara braunii TaxID=69332 RepID=A0A388LUM7_CHABU|nr:hypothetical protein CBR_g40756 [Chara braunii]|eukprot:GBG85943.1 hypothetical protein CBR_g40756 [Chara braunii]
MGHAYTRMKPREWKWLDVATRLSVDREADRCGKNWDNLMQQFKKDVEGLQFQYGSCGLRRDTGSTAKNHTINPKNVADIGAQGGVRLSSSSSADLESVDDDDGSTKGSSQTTGAAGGFGKRKSTRQQYFEAMTECMEKHGALMTSTMESNNKRHCSIAIRQCEALEAEVEVQKKHYAASDEVNKLICHALLEIAKAIAKR